jgi:hypothetical protein
MAKKPKPTTTDLHVDVNGSDANSGTSSSPLRTVGKALTKIGAGGVVWVHDGIFEEEIRNPAVVRGTTSKPVTVACWPGERPIVQGLLWLTSVDYWRIHGLNVTWGDALPSEHMVKFTGGVGWSFEDAEVWGAQSYAGLLVYGDDARVPSGWALRRLDVHDTGIANDTNQDHNIYVNTGLKAGTGLIERCLIHGAPNGENVKIGGSDSSGGSAGVAVSYCTLVHASQNVMVFGATHDTLIERCILAYADGSSAYRPVRDYLVSGVNNVVRDCAYWDPETTDLIYRYPGSAVPITDGGGNLRADPMFDADYRPTNPAVLTYGRWA